MALSVTHTFVSPIVDGGDPTLVGPDEWNDTHVVTGTVDGIRETLTTNRTYYIRAGGADNYPTHTGLTNTDGDAFASFQYAYDTVIAPNVDFNGHTVTLQGDGTTLAGMTVGASSNNAWTGGGNLILDNAGGTLTPNAADTISTAGTWVPLSGIVTVQNAIITSVGVSTFNIGLVVYGIVVMGPGVVFGDCTDGHRFVGPGGYLQNSSPNTTTISGDTKVSMWVVGGICECSADETISVPITVGLAYWVCDSEPGAIRMFGSFVNPNNVTGQKFFVGTGCSVQVFGLDNDPTLVPGTIQGIVVPNGSAADWPADAAHTFTGVGNFTIKPAEQLTIVNKASGAATTVTLPLDSAMTYGTFSKIKFTIKDGKGDAATNPITIVAQSGGTINGASSYIINSNYGSVTVFLTTEDTNTWLTCSTDAVLDDTTPQLGGTLDTNAFDIQFDNNHGIFDDSNNEQLLFPKTASAVNYVTIGNAAATDPPTISAAGSDTNVGLLLAAKNAEQVYVSPSLSIFAIEAETGFTFFGGVNPDYVDAFLTTSGGDIYLGTNTTGASFNYIFDEIIYTNTTGDPALTIDVTGLVTIIDGAGFKIGSSIPFSDSAGTLTLQNIDALDSTTESTIEAAIDTLANLTSVQGRTVTLADAGFDVLFGWDDSANAYKNFALADLSTEGAPATGDYLVLYGAEGDVRKVNWSSLPGAGGGISNVVEDTSPQLGGDLDGNNFSIFLAKYSADADGQNLSFFKSRNASVGSQTIVQNDDQLGSIIWLGSDGTDPVLGAVITASVDGTPGTADMPARLTFSTTSDGSDTPVEAFRITAESNLTNGGDIITGAFGSHAALQLYFDSATKADNWGNLQQFAFANTADSPWITHCKSRATTAGSHAIVQDDDGLSYIAFFGDDGVDYQEAANIKAIIDGTPGVGDMPGRLVFSTTKDGENFSRERLRILSTGAVQAVDTEVTSAYHYFDGTLASSSVADAVGFAKARDATNARRYTFFDIGGLTGDSGGGAFWRGLHMSGPGITDPSGGASVFPRFSQYFEYNTLTAPSTRNFCWDMANTTATTRHTFRIRVEQSDVLVVDPTGIVSFISTAQPNADDGAALGTTSKKWSDLFLASGAVINWNSGDVTETHSADTLTWAGGTTYSFNAGQDNPVKILASGSGFSEVNWKSGLRIIAGATADASMYHDVPTGGSYIFRHNNTVGLQSTVNASFPGTNDGMSLGTTANMWSDLFLADGGVINWNNGDVLITQSTNNLAFTGATNYSLDAQVIITTTSTSGFAVGRQGATNPVLNVNANTASVVTGLNLIGAAATGRLAMAVTSSTTDEGLSIDAKGAGTIRLGATSTGAVEFSRNAVPTSSDGAALGTTALMWSDLFLASGGVINFNNGNLTLTHAATNLTIAGGSLTLAAGGATAAPLIFQAGTNLTTAADGAMEFDGQILYFSPDGTDRRIVATTAYIRQHAAYVLSNSTTNQKLFNSSTNGQVLLPTGTYRFNCMFSLSGMSATSGNAAFSVAAGSGATVTNGMMYWTSIDATTTPTAGAAFQSGMVRSVTGPTNLATATTATEMQAYVTGTFEVSVAGQVIPSIALVTGITATNNIGGFFECWKLGATTDTNTGKWS